jgi:hypothetical protein
MKIKYKLKEVAEDVYLCTIKDSYDLTMTFCRVQEFYESHFKQIRGKKFKMLDFIKLYTQWSSEGAFTYTTDWVGFNVPSSCIENLFKLGIDDFNEYDNVICNIHNKINKKRYYLIAGCYNDTDTIKHELCHAFYYLDKNYKKHTNNICKELLPTVYKKIEKRLLSIGYCKQVIRDEVQAYLSTDIGEIREIKFNKKELKNFNTIKSRFEKYFKQVKQSKNIKI